MEDRATACGLIAVPRDRYRALPALAPDAVPQTRFIANALVYGGGDGWYGAQARHDSAFVVPLDDERVIGVPLRHGVQRIEAMGQSAVIVGGDATGLMFTAVRLDTAPRATHEYSLEGASEGETRSHGFFFRPERRGSNAGVIGLPIAGAGRPGVAQLWSGSTAVLFLRNSGTSFEALGALSASSLRVDDNCRASCVDWYGNARPLFLDDRLVALMGYELVEGRLRDGHITEVARASFAPPPRTSRR
jgi:hypothetical protein